MEQKILVLALILVAVILVSGCVQLKPAENGQGTGGVENETPVANETPEQPIGGEETQTNASGKKCVLNTECDDADPCTTDSCISGVCINTVESGCAIKTEEKPYINAVNLLSKDAEFVEIKGKNWRIDNWQITNSKGTKYIKFAEYTTLNGALKIYSKCDISTAVEKFLCLDNEFFSDTSDKAILKDDKGNTVSEKA